MAFSVMVGCGETYFAAFALALGFGPVASGMVATLPVLVGAVIQLAAPLAVLTADPRLGAWMRRTGLCAIPEDLDPPPEVAAALAARG